MPSRRAIALIIAFWIASTAYIGYRDLWPRLFASGPPPVGIDLADEASQHVAIHWEVKWNGRPVGKLKTQMSYVDADDTFWFTNQYRDLHVEVAGANLHVPEFTTAIRVTRTGDLREQTAEGTVKLEAGGLQVGEVKAKLAGKVVDGKLVANFAGSYEVLGAVKSITRDFDPVPVKQGQPLNPLLPVNRLRGVQPGREWVVHESNPLNDVVQAVARELGLPPQKKEEPLVGRVLKEPVAILQDGNPVQCWIIEYRREGELEVATWVRATDGKVLKQEAYSKGERLSIERDE